MRIALAIAVLFGVVYMVALKPKPETASVAPPPVAAPAPAAADAGDANAAQTGLGKAVESARGAVDAAESGQAERSGETKAPAASAPATTETSPSTPPATAAETAPEADSELAGLPKWLQTSMDRKVVAILFTNGTSADDRRTRKALDAAYTAHGKVVTRAVPVAQISKYRSVAQGVDVAQSPTLMVIDRDRAARTLVGYSNVDTINQAIIDGLLATDRPVRRVEYLQTVQHECRQMINAAIVGPTVGETPAGARRNVNALIATIGSSLGTLRNAPVPAAYRPVSRLVNRWLARSIASWKLVRDSAIGSKAVNTAKVKSITQGMHGLRHRTLLELNAVGVRACN
jgi:hypothetical protein